MPMSFFNSRALRQSHPCRTALGSIHCDFQFFFPLAVNAGWRSKQAELFRQPVRPEQIVPASEHTDGLRKSHDAWMSSILPGPALFGEKGSASPALF